MAHGGINTRFREIVMQALGLAVLLIGVKGALQTDALLMVIASMVAGGLTGEALKIETRLESVGLLLERRLAAVGRGQNIARGFVLASLIFCVGAMAIVGSLESGLTGNHQTLYAKSMLDGIGALIFASTMGLGVLFAAVSVLVYQGTITLAAGLLKPFLTPAVISQMSAVGGLLIMSIGINLLEIGKIRVGNLLPAIFVPLIYFAMKSFWGP